MNKLFFVLIHLGSLAAIWCGVSTTAVVCCILFYLVRMFAITAGFHRLFSHRSYKTSRVFQFVIALIGTASAQKGPLWWAASHRHHHRHSDTEKDLHSPGIHGLWWAHAGWVLSSEHDTADIKSVSDLSRYPELRLLDTYHFVPPLVFLLWTYLLGMVLASSFPSLGTSGFQIMIWGALVSTVILYHATFAINSVAHVLGKKRFKTDDESKNSLLLALITLGEGWHNNHHRYPASERQGFYWWEVDFTHYGLWILSLLGIVWDLRSPPAGIYEEANLRAS